MDGCNKMSPFKQHDCWFKKPAIHSVTEYLEWNIFVVEVMDN